MADKDVVRELLMSSRFGDIPAAVGSGPQVFRVLLSLAFNKNDLLCWRAIEAVGRVAGEMTMTSPDRVRTQVQRLLWMMRDESGNNVSSAPEMLGEIVSNSPVPFSDIAPILASFHDEEGLRRGVMYGVLRIAQGAPALAAPSSFLCSEYINDRDPVVRAYSVLLAGALRLVRCRAAIRGLYEDTDEVRLYRNGAFVVESVGKIARETDILLAEE